MPMYWHVHGILDARTMARIVLDVAWNEGSLRRRPITPKQPDIGEWYRGLGVWKTGYCVNATYVKRYSDNRAYMKVSHCIICLWLPACEHAQREERLKIDVKNLCPDGCWPYVSKITRVCRVSDVSGDDDCAPLLRASHLSHTVGEGAECGSMDPCYPAISAEETQRAREIRA